MRRGPDFHFFLLLVKSKVIPSPRLRGKGFDPGWNQGSTAESVQFRGALLAAGMLKSWGSLIPANHPFPEINEAQNQHLALMPSSRFSHRATEEIKQSWGMIQGLFSLSHAKMEPLVHLDYLCFWWMQTSSNTFCEELLAQQGSPELASGRRRFIAASQHIWKKIIAADALQKGNICVHQWLNCFLLYHIP